ncbi:unnamed protein product [Lactuca saligna]|uniref:Uncharacterized protein n=1 Tax=Lactuca saligna TaxID=75948 RepID=A0AA36A402_LACSI|nr:unnamed protein product [Lactuca saligna]
MTDLKLGVLDLKANAPDLKVNTSDLKVAATNLKIVVAPIYTVVMTDLKSGVLDLKANAPDLKGAPVSDFDGTTIVVFHGGYGISNRYEIWAVKLSTSFHGEQLNNLIHSFERRLLCVFQVGFISGSISIANARNFALHKALWKIRGTLLNNQVCAPLSALIRGASLEDARHLAHNCDRLHQEGGTHV